MMVNMTCDQVRQAHPRLGDDARAHLAGCAECRAFVDAWDLLGQAPEIAPKADFLQGVRRKLSPPLLRFAGPLAAVAAVLLVAVVLFLRSEPATGPSTAGVTDEERELVEHLEVLQNYELLSTLELLNETPPLVGEERK